MSDDAKRMQFQSLTMPHVDRLVALASRWAGRQEAEDDVQETYLRAWISFDQLREVPAVFAWLCQILRTVATERRRTHARRQELVFISRLQAAHQELIASDVPSPLEDLLARLEFRRLLEALRSIPDKLAEAVELHDVHDLKYREIARITSVPIGTVMSRINRGRRLLAGLLAVTDEEEMRLNAQVRRII